jgi:hypothetical protein
MRARITGWKLTEVSSPEVAEYPRKEAEFTIITEDAVFLVSVKKLTQVPSSVVRRQYEC